MNTDAGNSFGGEAEYLYGLGFRADQPAFQYARLPVIFQLGLDIAPGIAGRKDFHY
jgi:hypothetical protein